LFVILGIFTLKPISFILKNLYLLYLKTYTFLCLFPPACLRYKINTHFRGPTSFLFLHFFIAVIKNNRNFAGKRARDIHKGRKKESEKLKGTNPRVLGNIPFRIEKKQEFLETLLSGLRKSKSSWKRSFQD